VRSRHRFGYPEAGGAAFVGRIIGIPALAIDQTINVGHFIHAVSPFESPRV
jgi:hypothetical protein